MLNPMMRVALLATLCSLTAHPAAAVESPYGELKPGVISQVEQTGVKCELCRDHLFDPAAVSARLPAGYRFISASEYAKDDSAVALLVAKDPRYASYAVGSLCFMLADTFLVDGVLAHTKGAKPMAFWWAHAELAPGAKPDPRMHGKLEYLQLGSWYSTKGTDRARILTADPMAEFVDLKVQRRGPNAWRMRLPLATEIVEAEVRGDGKRIRRNTTGPGFMTVPFTGNSADRFTVYTYFGHHHQEATGTWRATGSGVFTSAFALPGENEAFGTFYQDGWRARSGLYRFGE